MYKNVYSEILDTYPKNIKVNSLHEVLPRTCCIVDFNKLLKQLGCTWNCSVANEFPSVWILYET